MQPTRKKVPPIESNHALKVTRLMIVYCRFLITASLAALIFWGCAGVQGPGLSGAERSAPVDRPENAYFYYTKAQLARRGGDREQAIEYLKKAVELDSQSTYLKRELAVEYAQQKDQVNALALIEDILKSHPDDVETLILYGRIKQSQNQLENATQAYEKVIALDKQQQNVYLLLGGIYLQEERFDDAQRVFSELLAQFPEAYTGYYFLGKIYAEKGQIADAEKAFKKALEIEPSLLEPRFELLDLYRSQGKSDIIVRTYEDILKNNPFNIRAALELGLIYWKEGRRLDAEKLLTELGRRSTTEFDVVLKIIQTYLEPDRYQDAIIVIEGLLKGSPDNPDLHHLAGVAYYGLKNNDKALMNFSKVTPESRFYQDAVVHLAFLYREKGKRQEAAELLEQTVRKNPDNGEFMYYLGTFYEEDEEYEKAEQMLQRAIDIEPDEAKFHFRLGVLYDKWGRKDSSIEQMKTVLKLDPQHANALNYLGYTYADLGKNLEEAERLIKEALSIKPDDGYITDSLGWVYYKMGRYTKALELLKRAVELVPDDPVILEHLGDAYLKINDKENALRSYERSLENDHKDRKAIEEKIRLLKEHP